MSSINNLKSSFSYFFVFYRSLIDLQWRFTRRLSNHRQQPFDLPEFFLFLQILFSSMTQFLFLFFLWVMWHGIRSSAFIVKSTSRHNRWLNDENTERREEKRNTLVIMILVKSRRISMLTIELKSSTAFYALSNSLTVSFFFFIFHFYQLVNYVFVSHFFFLLPINSVFNEKYKKNARAQTYVRSHFK